MSELPSNLFTIDFESTGIDPKTAHPVEVALIGKGVVFERLIKPPIPIPPETSAVHQIIDDDVVDADDWESIKEQLKVYLDTKPLPFLVAHNASYEKDILGDNFVPVLWICTYKCALRVWPDAPNHKNETLRYWLGLGDNLGRNNHQSAHNAKHDAMVTSLLVQELLKHTTLEDMVQWTEEPALLPRMPIGKYFGKPWNEVPAQYLTWAIGVADMREDVVHCAKKELERRRKR